MLTLMRVFFMETGLQHDIQHREKLEELTFSHKTIRRVIKVNDCSEKLDKFDL